MKTILFPTDFSENSLHAAQYAGMLARKFDAKLVILHVFTHIISLSSQSQLMAQNVILDDQLEKNAEKKLCDFSDKLIQICNLPKVQVEQKLEVGIVTDIIIRTAEEVKADMIVIGTKGVTNAIDKLLGSNAESVVKSAKRPVWVVPYTACLNVPMTFLYASDLEENETNATQTLLDFATPLGAEYKVIHINEYFDKEVNEASKATIKNLKSEFSGKNITFKELNRKEVVEGIEAYVSTHKPDVLALAIYDKSFFSNLFLGSITTHFVEKANTPLLIFKKEKIY
jgi:nucleotide-binding universal stress UspA family protein